MNLTKRQKIGGAAGAVVVLGGVLYWRHKSASSSTAAASSTDPNAVDPLTGMPYSQDQQTDPLTGMTYLAEAQQYGSVAAAEAAFSGGAPGGSGYSAGYGISSGGTAGYPTANVGASTSTAGGYTTNAQWAQAVQAGLAGLGYDSTTVAAALGAFFAQLPLTAQQSQIIQTAEAEFGPPPQGTYAIVSQPSSGGASSPSSTSSSSSTTANSSSAIAVEPVDLHTTHVYTDSAQVAWLAPRIPNGQTLTGYGVEAYDRAGHLVNGPFDVPPTQLYANVGSLHSKTTYHVNVYARPAKTGGPHATTTFTTK